MNTFAYLGSSKEGGTYRVFETLRDGLAAHGWQGYFVNATSLAPEQHGLTGKALAPHLCDHLASFDVVIGNVFVDSDLMNIIRYLPPRLPRLMIVHNITFATYQAARALRNHVHLTVAVSPRIRNDLVTKQGFPADQVSTILNSVTADLFNTDRKVRSDGRIGILSLGRLEENSKRIFALSEMLTGLPENSYQLTIVGDGPDGAELIRRLKAANIPHEALGRVNRFQLTDIYAQNEIFLFPSRFEGMGIALAEAMASGLVPVAARIPGVTESFIKNGSDGFLFQQGDFDTGGMQISKLLAAPRVRKLMGDAARERAQVLFTPEIMINQYADLLDRITKTPRTLPILDPAHWALPRGLRPGLRAALPSGLRRHIANWVLYK